MVYSTELSFLTLYFRNALSNMISVDVIHFQYTSGTNISIAVILSAVSSLLSTAYKKNTPFQSLSQATQEFISDPLDIQQLKCYHNIGTHYPDLVKIDYLKQIKIEDKQFNLYEEYYKKKPQISLKKKLYILLINICHVLGIAIIQVQIDYTNYYVPDLLRKVTTTIFIMPQFIVYIITRLKKKDKTLQFFIQKINHSCCRSNQGPLFRTIFKTL
ncbi:hypothetical protein PPERSA_02263 [Pseudocohnilembus persalinus]|uniref:Transmembrane protein n=1 Tax=Pseudocohnilembus persalinus TaxID=266149 RepID=A0A0V0QLE2_PSEPJ|nr:hypothetical protein PPERSA_02263 [Pseudocohnilembus persalinus]|eukprot:KRX02773.1 hypothetical protein PPERSA_02263 [Pseudocohnilembus persalinus]